MKHIQKESNDITVDTDQCKNYMILGLLDDYEHYLDELSEEELHTIAHAGVFTLGELQ